MSKPRGGGKAMKGRSKAGGKSEKRRDRKTAKPKHEAQAQSQSKAAVRTHMFAARPQGYAKSLTFSSLFKSGTRRWSNRQRPQRYWR